MTTLRFDLLDTAIERDEVARNAWREVRDGREIVCAWLLLAPEGTGDADFSACPAVGLPEWCARLIPWMDDGLSDAAWKPTMLRMSRVLRHAVGTLTAEQWQRLDYVCRRIAVLEAREHVPAGEVAALRAIDDVAVLLDRAIAGDVPTSREWAAAANAAAANAAAARAAAAAARATAATEEAAAAAAWAAEVAAARADRMAARMLDAIEAGAAGGHS